MSDRGTSRSERKAPVSASTGVRFASGLIDAGVFVVSVGVGTLLFGDPSDPFPTLKYVVLAVSFLQLLPEVLLARSLGKVVVGTRVVAVDGSKPSTRQLLNRAVYKGRVLVNALSLLREARGRHDRLSGTFVVGSARR